jgi:hypothetical protein
MKFLKKLTQPTTLSHNVSNCHVLGLGTRTRNCVLPLGLPRYQSITKINTITRSRTPRIRTTSPVGIRIGCEGINRTCTNVEDKRQYALHITQDALDKCKMWLPRIMHEQTDLLNSICKIRTSQGEVLQSSSKTPVLRGIDHRCTICGRQLGLRIHWRRYRMAITHTSTLKKVQGILSLRQR